MSAPLIPSTFAEAEAWLYNHLDYERARPTGARHPFGLACTETLLEAIGSPHRILPVVHIAGTKGKGSVAAIFESIARSHGLRTCLFTSPHLMSVRERLRVDGFCPDEETFVEIVQSFMGLSSERVPPEVSSSATFFELMTVLGWHLFASQNPDVVVLETGLGGRLDCTNTCQPTVCVITRIGLDHTHILGNTLEAIAREKAGILKPGIPCIRGAMPREAADVIDARAAELGCPLWRYSTEFEAIEGSAGQLDIRVGEYAYGNLRLALPGAFQAENAAAAVAAWITFADLIPETPVPRDTGAVQRGLAEVHWPLRLEKIADCNIGGGSILLDAAHNGDAAVAVAEFLRRQCDQPAGILVVGISTDKDATAVLAPLLPLFQHVICTRFCENPRAVAPEVLRSLAEQIFRPASPMMSLHTADTPQEALETARQLANRTELLGPAEQHDLDGPSSGAPTNASRSRILVTGSVFLAAEVRALLTAEPPFPSRRMRVTSEE